MTEIKNTRRTYKYDGHDYKEVPFLSIKKGDMFVMVEADGTPVPNRDGSVVCVATKDAYIRDVPHSKVGIWAIEGDLITEKGVLDEYRAANPSSGG